MSGLNAAPPVAVSIHWKSGFVKSATTAPFANNDACSVWAAAPLPEIFPTNRYVLSDEKPLVDRSCPAVSATLSIPNCCCRPWKEKSNWLAPEALKKSSDKVRFDDASCAADKADVFSRTRNVT